MDLPSDRPMNSEEPLLRALILPIMLSACAPMSPVETGPSDRALPASTDDLTLQRTLVYGAEQDVERQQQRVAEARQFWQEANVQWNAAQWRDADGRSSARSALQDAAESLAWHERELELAELRRDLAHAELSVLEAQTVASELSTREKVDAIRDELIRLNVAQAEARRRLDALDTDGVSSAETDEVFDIVEAAAEADADVTPTR